MCQPGDWPALLRTQCNLLLTGPLAASDAFLRAAAPILQEPVHHIACEHGLQIARAARTLILRNLDALACRDQRALMRWLEQPPRERAQVISQSAGPLYELVQAGAFEDALFYRLNVIHVQLAAE